MFVRCKQHLGWNSCSYGYGYGYVLIMTFDLTVLLLHSPVRFFQLSFLFLLHNHFKANLKKLCKTIYFSCMHVHSFELARRRNSCWSIWVIHLSGILLFFFRSDDLYILRDIVCKNQAKSGLFDSEVSNILISFDMLLPTS